MTLGKFLASEDFGDFLLDELVTLFAELDDVGAIAFSDPF